MFTFTSLPNLLKILFVSLVFASCSLVQASEGRKDRYEKYFEDIPWKKVEKDVWTGDLGDRNLMVRETTLPGEIKIIQRKKPDGRIETFTADVSGLGAVQCLWEVVVHISAYFEYCPINDADWQKALGTALHDIDKFIVENMDPPVNFEALSKIRLDHFSTVKMQIDNADKAKRSGMCKAGPNENGLLWNLHKQGIKKFKYNVKKALSVPRLPVMSPCL